MASAILKQWSANKSNPFHTDLLIEYTLDDGTKFTEGIVADHTHSLELLRANASKRVARVAEGVKARRAEYQQLLASGGNIELAAIPAPTQEEVLGANLVAALNALARAKAKVDLGVIAADHAEFAEALSAARAAQSALDDHVTGAK